MACLDKSDRGPGLTEVKPPSNETKYAVMAFVGGASGQWLCSMNPGCTEMPVPENSKLEDYMGAYHGGRVVGALGAAVTGVAEIVSGIAGGTGAVGAEGASVIGILAIPATAAVAAAVVTHGLASAVKGAAEAGNAGKDLYSQMKKQEGTRVERPSVGDKPAGSTTPDGAGQKPPEGPEPGTASPEKGPTEAYNREKHYGKTPTSADRKALGADKNEVVDHQPELVKRYYEGDAAAGEKPGWQMTPAERQASGADRSRMQLQPKSESNAQGGKASAYSKEQKKKNGL